MFFFLINGPKPKTIQFRKVSDRDEKKFEPVKSVML